jgi:hypothetical protein
LKNDWFIDPGPAEGIGASQARENARRPTHRVTNDPGIVESQRVHRCAQISDHPVFKKIDALRIFRGSVGTKIDTDCSKIRTKSFNDWFPHPRDEPGPMNKNRGVARATVIMYGYFYAIF